MSTAVITDDFMTALHDDLRDFPGAIDVDRVSRVASQCNVILDRQGLLSITSQIRHNVSGLGPLHPLLTAQVTDILVNPDGSVWVEDDSGLSQSSITLTPAESRALASRLAALGGRRLDDAMPWADAQLPGGLRFHALLPPLSTGGATISLRRAATTPFSLADLRSRGALTTGAERLIAAIVDARLAFLVSGGTGSGKTTLISAMLGEASPGDRIVIVEDASELRPAHPHVVSIQSRHANTEGAGEVSLGTLVRQCLRMRPDRIIVGECRGAEVRELLQALNTGHEGGGGTLHANTAADVPARLEALGALAGMSREALTAQARSAIEVVLHMERQGGKRFLSTAAVLGQGPSGELVAKPAVRWEADGGRPRVFPAFGLLEARLSITKAEVCA